MKLITQCLAHFITVDTLGQFSDLLETLKIDSSAAEGATLSTALNHLRSPGEFHLRRPLNL